MSAPLTPIALVAEPVEPQIPLLGGSCGCDPQVIQKMHNREFTEPSFSAAGVCRYSCHIVTPGGATTVQLVFSPLTTLSLSFFTSSVMKSWAMRCSFLFSSENEEDVPWFWIQ